MKKFVSALVLAACCATLPNCGGGGGGSDSSPATVRPKTMDDIILTLDRNASFRFSRSIGSSAAVTNSDIETGSFTYTGRSVVKPYNTTQGGLTNVVTPRSITTGRYTYKPSNSVGGTLTLSGDALSTIPLKLPSPGNPVLYLFLGDTFGRNQKSISINITFNLSGSVVTSNAAVVSALPSSSSFDSVIIPTTISVFGGGGVPPDYNPTLDPNRPSKVAPASLNNAFYNFTSGTNNPALNFTLQFAANANGIPMINIDEIGEGILTVNGVVITNSEAYTYTRTPGTDDAVLVLSGAGNAVNGSYILKFSGTQVGTYIGSTPGLSGNFRVVTSSLPNN